MMPAFLGGMFTSDFGAEDAQHGIFFFFFVFFCDQYPKFFFFVFFLKLNLRSFFKLSRIL